MRRALLSSAAVAVALALAGCGGGGSSTVAVADSPAGAELLGETPAELKEAGEVQHYLGINCPLPGTIQKLPPRERRGRLRSFYEGAEAMCGHMASIEVQGKRVTIRSDIGSDVERQAGLAFCNLIAGSDVADFTKGHELQDLDGRAVKVCPLSD